jgi:hypothetical protein
MRISQVVHINPEQVLLNGKVVCAEKPILKRAYSALDLSYPKFFKMDTLSKLGLIGAEYIARSANLEGRYEDDEIALLFNNRDSSLESDVKHQKTLSNPSPAVFVYTLPNIVLGEIAIKNKWYGEQLCTVSDTPDAGLIQRLSSSFVKTGKAKAVIIVVINSLDENFDARIALVEKDESGEEIPFTLINLEQILT